MNQFGLSPVGDRRPLAVRIYDQLFETLTKPGRVGIELPTELELTRELGVSRTTVRQALALLEEDGVVERGAGRRRIVAAGRRRSDTAILPLEEAIAAGGEELQVKVVSRQIVPATHWTAGLLNLELGTLVTVWESTLSTATDGVIVSALELTTTSLGADLRTDTPQTLLDSLGAEYRSTAQTSLLRLSAQTADVRADIGATRADHDSRVVVTQVLTTSGQPTYLAKNVVRLSGLTVNLLGGGSSE